MALEFRGLEQFLTHTDKHRDNVTVIAERLFDTMLDNPHFVDKYKMNETVDKNELKDKFSAVIKVHDKAKMLDSPKFLKKHGLEKPFYKFLFDNVGKVIDGEGRKVIDKMNDIDGLLTTMAMHNQGLTAPQREMFSFIEHISDIVERGCNPLTKYELGRDVSKASEFKRGNCNMHELNAILEMELFYEQELLPKQKIFAKNLLLNEPRQGKSVKFPKKRTNEKLLSIR